MGIPVPIPFTGPSYQGRSSAVNTQECINLRHNIDRSGGKSVLSLMGRHCLEDFSDLGGEPIRGMVEEGNIGYVVSGSRFYSVANDGTAVHKGTLLSSSGNVGMASNGFDILICDGADGYNYDIAGASFTTMGGTFLGGDCVTFIDQYFVVNKPDTGVAQSSGLADGTAWAAADVATAEGDPDNLIRAIAVHGDLWLMGDRTAEPYFNVNNPTGFPFGRKGQGYIDMGLAARWSAAVMDNTLYWMAKNREGHYGICRAAGYTPQKISTPAIDYQINAIAAAGTITDAIAFTFSDEGHSFYVLTFPTGNKTLVFDAATGLWSEWQSRGLGRFRCQYHMMLTTSHIVGDSQNGKLYKLKQGIYDDAGITVEKIRTTQFLHKSGREITINSLWVDFESGTGLSTGQGEDPMAMLQFSKDQGKTWSNEYWVPIGKIGEYGDRAKWTRLGSAYTWTFRLKVSDPVKCIIIGAYCEMEVGDD